MPYDQQEAVVRNIEWRTEHQWAKDYKDIWYLYLYYIMLHYIITIELLILL